MFATTMASRPASKTVVNVVTTSNSRRPSTTASFVKTSNSLRPQYSLEAIDPDILPLLANQLNMKLKSIGVDNNGNVYSGNSLSRLVDIKTLREFTLFSQLPPELRIKIWNMAILPRVVLMHDYAAITYRPDPTVALYTPCIPALLQVSREARQIGLENYEVVQEENSGPGDSREHLSPMYLNPKLDTFVCVEWDGTYLGFTDHQSFPKRILKQAREVCLYVSEIFDLIETVDEEEWPDIFENEKRPILDGVYEFFRDFESLETCLLHFAEDSYDEEIRGPWKLEVFNKAQWLARDAINTWMDLDDVKDLKLFKMVLEETAAVYPDWKVPGIVVVHVDYTELFDKE